MLMTNLEPCVFIDHGVVHRIAESDNKMNGASFDSYPVVFIWGEHSWGGVANVRDHLCATSQTLLFEHREVATHEARAERLPNDCHVQSVDVMLTENVHIGAKNICGLEALVKTEENTEPHRLSERSVKRFKKQNSIK